MTETKPSLINVIIPEATDLKNVVFVNVWYVIYAMNVKKKLLLFRGGNFVIYTTGNSDNLTVACMGLDIFTKSWCMDCEFTKKHNHLTYRCDECEFSTNKGDCLIKQFVISHTGDLPKDLGSMGL